MTEWPMYYDRQGRPMTIDQWAATFEGGPDKCEELKRVAETTVGPCWISTVWLGIDHRFGEGPPLIFETMIFVKDAEAHPAVRDMDNECWRCSTEAQALAGHDQVVAAVRNLLADVEAADQVMTEAAEQAGSESDA